MSLPDKIISRESLIPLIASSKAEGKRVGYTSGVFDILHAGHVEYLELARSRCDFLVLGLNSDDSVRSYKADGRPIVSEADRARVVSALASIDKVFIFSERNNNLNIELLKPDIYFKAGDYDKKSLSSAPIIESYGGRVDIIKFTSGQSSSRIIEKIENQVLARFISAENDPVTDPAPVVFLDRDGTINQDISYLHEEEKLELIPGVLEGLKLLLDSGFRLVIVTNQPGIGLGYYSKEDFFALTRALFRKVSSAGIKFSKVYFCPHSESEKCSCRKPSLALFERARQEINIDWANSYMIGDMTSDIKAGLDAGLKTILVQTGSAGKDIKYDCKPTAMAADLHAAAKLIVAGLKQEA